MVKYLPLVKKAVAALVVCVLALVAQGLLPTDAATVVQILTPILAALGVYVAPANKAKGQD